MPVAQTSTTSYKTDADPVADYNFANWEAMSQEEGETLHRCDGNFAWGQEQDAHLNSLCHELADELDNNPDQQWNNRSWYNLQRWRWKQWRTMWGYTAASAAEEVGVNPATISRYETGARDPDSIPYRTFLTKLWGNSVAYYRTHIFVECMIRDAWPHHPSGPEMTATWEAFWRPGGYYDTWRQTATMPNTNTWGETSTGILAARAT